MLDNFQLAAIAKQGATVRLKQIPMHQELGNKDACNNLAKTALLIS